MALLEIQVTVKNALKENIVLEELLLGIARLDISVKVELLPRNQIHFAKLDSIVNMEPKNKNRVSPGSIAQLREVFRLLIAQPARVVKYAK